MGWGLLAVSPWETGEFRLQVEFGRPPSRPWRTRVKDRLSPRRKLGKDRCCPSRILTAWPKPKLQPGLSSPGSTRYGWGSRRIPPASKGWCHDRQDELPRFLHRARHPVQERLARREGVSRAGGLANRGGNAGLGAGGDHRPTPDHHP